MAKTTIKAGGELDLLTQAELKATLEEILSGYLRGPQTVRVPAGVVLDANGAGSVEIFTVPTGYSFDLKRLTVDPDGYTPGSPFTSNTGYLEIRRGGRMQDFVTLQGGLPAVYLQTSDAAIRYTNGETVELLIVDGPPSTSVYVAAQGVLEAQAQPQVAVT